MLLREPDNDTTTFTFPGAINFFDENRDLVPIQGPFDFKIQEWCENDGGVQTRPTLKLVINKSKLKRKLTRRTNIQNIACFVIANPSAIQNKTTNSVSKNIVMTGDRNNDGQIDCFISTYYDEAENCDGQPLNHLRINLNAGGITYALRCCGP
ncbi:MAG: hypothetical protein WDO14_14120 [Bacteroidota bacterium]